MVAPCAVSRSTATALLVLAALHCANGVVRYQTVWAASQLGDPLKGQCGLRRGAPSAVCDASGQLASRALQRIDEELQVIRNAGRSSYARSKCNGNPTGHGYLIEVALVRRMASGPVSEFARQLFQSWEAGAPSECGNGILMLVSTEDHAYSFIVGKGAKRLLPNRRMKRVSKVLTAYMRKSNLYLGVLNAVIKLGEELGDASPRSLRGSDSAPLPAELVGERRRPQRHSWWFWFVAGVAALMGAAVVGACCNGFGGKDAVRLKKMTRIATKKLQLVKQEYDAAGLPQYTPITCSVCQGDLTPGLSRAASSLDERDQSAEYSSIEDTGLGPVRHLRCGHKFHAACLEKQGTTRGGVTVCPVCNDSSDGADAPPSLRETRDRDLAFRVTNLKLRYPEVITDDVHKALLSPPPPLSSTPRAPDDGEREYRTRTQGPAWGALAGAAGIGALSAWGLSSMFGGWGGGDNGSRYYGDNNQGNWGGDYGSAFSGGWGADSGGDAIATAGHWANTFTGGNDVGSAFSGGWGGGGGGGNSSYSGGW